MSLVNVDKFLHNIYFHTNNSILFYFEIKIYIKKHFDFASMKWHPDLINVD